MQTDFPEDLMTSLRTGPLVGGVASGFPSTNQSVSMQMSRSGEE